MPDPSWEDAERAFPGCSAQWDAQRGDVWLGASEPVMVIHNLTLAIGCDHPPKARWAVWNQEKKQWIFIPTDNLFSQIQGTLDPRLQVDRRR